MRLGRRLLPPSSILLPAVRLLFTCVLSKNLVLSLYSTRSKELDILWEAISEKNVMKFDSVMHFKVSYKIFVLIRYHYILYNNFADIASLGMSNSLLLVQ